MKTKSLLLATLLVSAVTIKAQWVTQVSGFSTPLGVNDISIVDANIVWASAFDTTGTGTVNKFTRTLNGGTTWTAGSVTGANALDISSIDAYNKDTAWVSMLDNNVGGGKIYRTNDGGATWTAQSTASFSAPGGSTDFVYMFNKNNGVCVGDSNSGYWEIYTTTNGGTNWTRVTSGNIPVNLAGEIGYENNYCAIGNTVWFGTSSGRVYKSTNMGATWTTTTTGLSAIKRVAFKDVNNGIATDGTSLVKTTNGGATWTPLSHTGTLYNTGLIYILGTTGTYMSSGATFYGGSSNGSSYSVDDGATWINIDAVGHSALAFLNSTTGWSGGVNTSPTVKGMFKWNGSFTTNVKSFTAQQFNIIAYPNPFKDAITFEIKSDQNFNQNLSILITDVLGRSIYSGSLSQGSNTVHIPLLNQGVYTYKVYNSDSVLGIGRVIQE